MRSHISRDQDQDRDQEGNLATTRVRRHAEQASAPKNATSQRCYLLVLLMTAGTQLCISASHRRSPNRLKSSETDRDVVRQRLCSNLSMVFYDIVHIVRGWKKMTSLAIAYQTVTLSIRVAFCKQRQLFPQLTMEAPFVPSPRVNFTWSIRTERLPLATGKAARQLLHIQIRFL